MGEPIKDSECSSCLEIKPVLYLTHYKTCYGDGEVYECSDCRMAHVLYENNNYEISELTG